jgi:dethiobiotin synthetase
MNIIVVTGTGTGVGKTVTTAALAACAVRAGRSVAVVKPVQTGVLPGEPGDLAEVRRLTGVSDLHEFVRYAEPLAPATAARRLGESGPDLQALADRIVALVDRDLVIVEGAGGVLVRFNDRDEGIRELIGALQDRLRSSPEGVDLRRIEVVLVSGAGLGCLHDAAAAAEALTSRGLAAQHLVVGDWPVEPGLAERCNLLDLPEYADIGLHGVIAHGAGRLEPAAFAEVAVCSLTPALGGRFDTADFVRRHAAAEPGKESRSPTSSDAGRSQPGEQQ